MDNKLQEITQKIYLEGVEKGKEAASEILTQTKKDAEALMAKTRKEADAILAQAKTDAEQLRQKTMAEIRMAGVQAVSLIKQEITDILSGATLSQEIKQTFEDPEFTKKLIGEMITKGDFSGENIDLNITLPERFQKELMVFFRAKAAHILQSGVELSFQSRMDGGFKISPKDRSFVLSFTDRDFMEYFKSFLKPKVKEILFPDVTK